MPKALENLRTWLEIDTRAICMNFASFVNTISPSVLKMVVVKSNAYGHDMVPFARLVSALGADFLGVDSFEEAFELRKNKIETPILVLGFTPSVNFAMAAKEDISVTISSIESLAHACKYKGKNKLKIHVKADTGLHRQGFAVDLANDVIKALSKASNVHVEGLYTHLAAAETPKYFSYTKKQIKEFNEWIDMFSANGLKPITHSCASAASIIHKDMSFGMVRIGISAYGLWASKETKARSKNFDLTPALSWFSVITEVKAIKKGDAVGYDLTEKVKRDSVIGIVPIGYWHGFPRCLSGKGEVLVNGKRAKILGRVSMDMTVIDITGIKGVKQGTIVTLIGRDGNDEIPAEEVAENAETINYEIVTRINAQIPRIYK